MHPTWTKEDPKKVSHVSSHFSPMIWLLGKLFKDNDVHNEEDPGGAAASSGAASSIGLVEWDGWGHFSRKIVQLGKPWWGCQDPLFIFGNSWWIQMVVEFWWRSFSVTNWQLLLVKNLTLMGNLFDLYLILERSCWFFFCFNFASCFLVSPNFSKWKISLFLSDI